MGEPEQALSYLCLSENKPALAEQFTYEKHIIFSYVNWSIICNLHKKHIIIMKTFYAFLM